MNNFFRFALMSLIFSSISACVTQSNPATINPISTKTNTTQVVISPSSATPDLSTPTNIIETTPMLTSTIFPIFEPSVAKYEIQRLLSAEDETCTFPCWWNIIPGKTRIHDAQNYLNSFHALSIGEPLFDDEWNFIILQLPQSNNLYLDITFAFKEKKDILEWLQVSLEMKYKLTNNEGQSWYEISWNNPALAEIITPYTLQNILLKYGEPSTILLFTHQTALLNQPLPMSVVLFYPQHGFMVEYVIDGKITPNNITGCPSLAFPYFWFWSPSEQITIKDVASSIAGYQVDGETIASFKTIQDAINMNTDQFYSLFKTDKNKCIETTKDIWPLPGQ